jgi:GTP-binding protein
MSSTVAIVGRPNVGKSTFFNRMLHLRKAIVDETSGVTRDRHYGKSDWNGKEFSLIDTGGYVANSTDIFETAIREQVKIAIEEADVILFLVDVMTGITDLDESIAKMLRKINSRVFVVVNKVDNLKRHHDIHEFHRLGLGELFPISSISGSGTGDLLDEVVKLIDDTPPEEELNIPKIGIIGRPNVGKSTLVNALIGDERNIVTDIPGTTRDTIYTHYNKFNHEFFLVDTAGLRKKTKVKDNIEFYSVMRTIKAIENSDICLLLIEAHEKMNAQDLNILHLVQKNNKGLILLANKWDLVEKDQNTMVAFEKKIKDKIEPFTDVPVIFTSALSKQRIQQVLETVERVYENRKRRVSTSRLNEVLQQAVETYRPPMVRGRHIKIKYATQLKTHYPAFAFFCNHPDFVKDSYKRYLENTIRKHFDFSGVPIKMYFRKK